VVICIIVLSPVPRERKMPSPSLQRNADFDQAPSWLSRFLLQRLEVGEVLEIPEHIMTTSQRLAKMLQDVPFECIIVSYPLFSTSGFR
jgi:hypothetical protein